MGADTGLPEYPGKWVFLTETLGFVLWLVISATGIVFENFNIDQDPIQRFFHDHGADFAMAGYGTCCALIVLHFSASRNRSARIKKICIHWAWPWAVSTAVLLFGLTYEWMQFNEHPSHGDWRDLVAEAVGWVLTIIPFHLAFRADHHARLSGAPEA